MSENTKFDPVMFIGFAVLIMMFTLTGLASYKTPYYSYNRYTMDRARAKYNSALRDYHAAVTAGDSIHLADAAHEMNARRDKLNQLVRDSICADSVAKIPQMELYRANWDKICHDWRDARIRHHQKRIVKLQQKQK